MALKKVTGVQAVDYTSSYEGTTTLHRFAIGESKHPPSTEHWISKTQYNRLQKLQSSKTISVGTIRGGKKSVDKIPVLGNTLWWHQDRFYVEDEDKEHPPGQQREKGIAGLMKIGPVSQDAARGSFPRFEKSYRFTIGTSEKQSCTAPRISQREYDALARLQRSNPTSLGIFQDGDYHRRTLWCYQDEFYVRKEHSIGVERAEGVEGLTNITSVHAITKKVPWERSKKVYRFQLGSFRDLEFHSKVFTAEEYSEAKKLQSSEPVSLGKGLNGKQSDKTLWWYQNEFYTEKDGYSSEQVKLLLWEKERKKERKFARLRKEMLSEHALEDARRERISEDVRIFVWKRDDARCVKCGSQENLEFDHIIPVSKGGSNTARNIQLLCETCNRRKSASI